MPLSEYYNQRHSSALNKISGRLSEGKEFIFAYDSESSIPINAQKAYTNRWYGNVSERKFTKGAAKGPMEPKIKGDTYDSSGKLEEDSIL
ncbi:MAG: hypothetical protein HQ557_14050 [Bacteroidetes bacterium]|nr:hypothetical protein [Bacteroidota bacterium]